ncbi:MAG: beta-galactosidase [Armatimonadota bacterium]
MRRMIILLPILMLMISFTAINCQAQGRRCAILKTAFPGEDSTLIFMLTAKLQTSGYLPTVIGIRDICDVREFKRARYDLLVLPDSSALPELSQSVIDSFLAEGGDIIALNAPLWQNPLIEINGRWVTRKEYRRSESGVMPEHLLFAFGSEGLDGWNKAIDDEDKPSSYEIVSEGPAAGYGSLHMTVRHQRGMNMFTSPAVKDPFSAGKTLTVFSAKGDVGAEHLRVDWTEKDGSMWTKTVFLSTKWERYMLKPEDFKYLWGGNVRGGADDRFRPEAAEKISFGTGYDIGNYAVSEHQIWIGPIGTEKSLRDDLTNMPDIPALDTLSPGYKFFDSNGVASIKVRSDQVIIDRTSIPLPDSIHSSYPRPRGAGFDKGRQWRWIPLLESRTSKGEWRGNPAVMLVHTDGKYKGGVWASFAIPDINWYKTPAVLKIIGQIARRMQDRTFIMDGGANYFTYFDEQNAQLGVRAANLDGSARDGLTARVRLTDAKTGKKVSQFDWPLSLSSGEMKSVSSTWSPKSWPADGLIATAEILDKGRVIDRVSHEVNIWKPKKVQERVTVKDGEFMLNGKRWRANGVNYFATSGAGMEDGNYLENWMCAAGYDPEVVDRDLQRMRNIGFNSVSIGIDPRFVKDQNLLDILRRLDKYGMKAYLFVGRGIYFPPGDPYWPQMKETFEYYKLWEHDSIFMYDIAWEPWMSYHNDRVPWDGEWEKWLVERYGSVENAERDWGYPVPRDDKGNVTNPEPKHFVDGEWRRMIAAYRRFTDTVLYKKYSNARRLIKETDPNALVSFRMAEAGNATFLWTDAMPYDFPYLAAGVDALSPEAYQRMGEWEQVKPGRFTYEYARLSDPSKPVLWAEGGYSTWNMGEMTQTKERLEFQAKFYEAFYRMLITSGFDGVQYWWYPGGYRWSEKSDFGVINPDGSDRPATRVIRKYSRAFIDGPSAKPVDKWIEVDRDKHPIGFGGVYREVKDEFWGAIDKGLTPGLRTSGTGTTSANCLLIAVGNTPCNGNNPPKYLDAVFDSFEVQDADGKWVPVSDGAEVTVNKDLPVKVRIMLTNLGEAEWIAGNDPGSVHLISEDGRLRIPIPVSVPHATSTTLDQTVITQIMGDTPVSVTLVLEAQGRIKFGEKYTVVLIPR